MEEYKYGYPKKCTRCDAVEGAKTVLRVAPYLKSGAGPKVMLLGQDPTIFRDPDRVKRVLMLDEENGQLRRWLKKLLGEHNFDAVQLYATNLVKCSFDVPPSTSKTGGKRFLAPYFANCQNYLREEIFRFRPELVLTFGEPTHQHFLSILDGETKVPREMKKAFSGKLAKVCIDGFVFRYSPCLHIKTFRVAETYGRSVPRFIEGLNSFFDGVSK